MLDQIGAVKLDRGGFESHFVVVVEPGYLRRYFVDHANDGRQTVVDQVLDYMATDEATTLKPQSGKFNRKTVLNG